MIRLVNTLGANIILVEDVDTSLSSAAVARGVKGWSEVVAGQVTKGRLHIGLVQA